MRLTHPSLLALSLLAACAHIDNAPVNVEKAGPASRNSPFPKSLVVAPEEARSTLIAVTLSGGGTRAASFGWGALSYLAEATDRRNSLAENIRVVAGVSAGAILGAHFVMSGPDQLAEFRARFLDQDVQSTLRTAPTPTNLLRASQGGINDRTGLPTWLQDNLFGGATLGDLDDLKRPRLIIHATDVENRSPFLFDQASFDSLCSDRNRFPLAEAVAASAAVPVLFAPIVIKNFSSDCTVSWSGNLKTGKGDNATRLDGHGLRSLRAYREGGPNAYVKLNDGGLVDNLGTGALMMTATLAQHRSAPFAPQETDFAREVMFLVVDGSTRNGKGINAELQGPGAVTTIAASVDAMIDTASRHSVDLLERWMHEWRRRVVVDRCARGLPKCGKLNVTLVRIALEALTEDDDAKRFAQSGTALRLTPEDVSFYVDKGRELLRSNEAFKAFERRIGGPAP